MNKYKIYLEGTLTFDIASDDDLKEFSETILGDSTIITKNAVILTKYIKLIEKID